MKNLEPIQYEYVISSFEIIIDDDINPVYVQNINGLILEKDYDNTYFPILYVSLSLSPDIAMKVYHNKTKVKFRVRMDRVLFGSNYKENVFDDIFVTFIKNDREFMSEDAYKKSKEVTGSGTSMTDMQEKYEFYLFIDKDISGSKKIFNGVLNNVSMTDTICYLLSQSGATDILMAKLDNSTVYSEVVLLPQPILKNISNLNNIYGFYTHDYLLYYDLDTTYFIDKNSECTAYRVNEYSDVVIYVPKASSSGAQSSSAYKDDDKRMYLISVRPDTLQMTSDSIVSQQIDGSEIISISPTTGCVTTVSPDIKYMGNKTQTVVVNKFSNMYTDKAIEYRKKENDSVISVPFNNIDIRSLSPNKNFKFEFENSSMQKTRGGKYRITGALFTFIKNGDSKFSLEGSATFKKV